VDILLDTHTFLWFIAGSDRLSARARGLIENPSVSPLLSIASLWEMAIKASLGKLVLRGQFETFAREQLTLNGISVLGIEVSHIAMVSTMPFHHRDPFDRLLVAQAPVEQLPILSDDGALDAYGAVRVW
jgi:PIN domain nuclease of toxin-antitoxin system